jgi:hypothetical protein
VLGGYAALRREWDASFQQVPVQYQVVLDKWQSDLEKAQAKSRE